MNPPNETTEVTYSPRSEIQDLNQLLARMAKDMASARGLAWRLMVRDISAQYRQTLLGYFWAFVPPIMIAITFGLMKSSGVAQFSETELPYTAFLIINMILWLTFVESMNGPVQAVTAARAMLAKVNFPREALILAKLGEVFFNFFIRVSIVIPVILIYKIPLSPTIVLAPFALLSLILFGTMLGIILSPLGALYQDIAKGLSVIFTFWMFLTPVVYRLPETGLHAIICQYNPVTSLLITTRELAFSSAPPTMLGQAILVTCFSAALFFVAWIFYRLSMPFLIEKFSA